MKESKKRQQEYCFFRMSASPRKKRQLLSRGTLQEWCEASVETLKAAGLTERAAAEFVRQRQEGSLWLREYHSFSESDISFITEGDKEYPRRLSVLPDRPFGLLVRGRLPAEELPTAAVIGARTCSLYGRDVAEQAGELLATSGVQVISGVAAGIDGAGHRGALRAAEKDPEAAPTFGVLGCGIRVQYPAENRGLYEQIPLRGGLISEYGPSEGPESWHFPMRNRLIAALSDLVLVPEARKKSGSLITVDFALEQGKDVYAVPGRITDPCSAGCNGLLQNGAGLILSLEELPGLLGRERKKDCLQKNSALGLARPEKLVYSCLDSDPKQEEIILEETGLTVPEAAAALLQLELRGLVKRSDGNYYRRA